MSNTPAYRVVRIGIRGRIPTIENTPENELTKSQIINLTYRKKNAEKRKEYAKNYYQKNRTKILTKARRESVQNNT